LKPSGGDAQTGRIKNTAFKYMLLFYLGVCSLITRRGGGVRGEHSEPSSSEPAEPSLSKPSLAGCQKPNLAVNEW
jgi:hypothetical protein